MLDFLFIEAENETVDALVEIRQTLDELVGDIRGGPDGVVVFEPHDYHRLKSLLLKIPNRTDKELFRLPCAHP